MQLADADGYVDFKQVGIGQGSMSLKCLASKNPVACHGDGGSDLKGIQSYVR